jgi:single-strand DNA-binding protein
VRYSQGSEPTAIARYSLAVDRKFKREGEQDADFINCVAFGKNGEFAEKYLHKGTKIAITGRIQTGSYTNKDNVKVYTTDVVVEEQEFCEKKEQASNEAPAPAPSSNDGSDFMSIPEGLVDELPFN